MTSEAPASPAHVETTTRPKPLRPWLPLSALALFWAYCFVTERMDLPAFPRFLSQMAFLGAVLLVMLIWWFTRTRFTLTQRFLPLIALIVGVVATFVISHKSLPPVLIHRGVPSFLTAWALAAALTASMPRERAVRWITGAILLAMTPFPFLRMDGMAGSGATDLALRWSPSAEDRYLAELAQLKSQSSSPATAPTLTLKPGDWPSFRGPNRDASVPDTRIATDLSTHPPKLLWKKRAGPGWSSCLVIDGHLFTQEQRGDHEAVICLDAATGSERWSHVDPTRFYESLGSAGPRATPTFHNSRLYALGATGILNCHDAATGKVIWSKNVATQTGNTPPMWGFSGSPLVVNNLAIVYAGAESQKDTTTKNLLAYHADTGELAWSASAGKVSYASPQLFPLAGKDHLILPTDRGVLSFDPATGDLLWEHVAQNSAPRTVQPLLLQSTANSATFLIGWGLDQPSGSLTITVPDSGVITTSTGWTSRFLKPSFNDNVLHQGHLYGFDGTVFACIDAATGNRKWKKGRYGAGQVLLLPDQSVLLVLSETGEVVVVAADPADLKELGRFQAIEGKTWNHPTLVGNRLFVRNSEEIACYELKPQE